MLAYSAIALIAVLARSPARAEAPRTVRLVLVHNHGEAVRGAARRFAERVEAESSGTLKVEVLTRESYGATRSSGPIGEFALLQDLAEGRIEMAQTYTNSFGRYAPDLFVLGLPYLFRDYAHAEAALEGPLGEEIRRPLDGSPVRLLAYTYSGGFGFFAARRELRSPQALRGLRLQMMRSRVSERISQLLQFERLPGPPEAFVPLAKEGLVDGLETTYSCFTGYGDDRYAPVVTETGHFLLTTALAANARFLDSLPAPRRAALERAARESAREERRESVALNSAWRAELLAKGVKVVDLTAAERAAFVEAMKPVTADMRNPRARALAARIAALRDARPEGDAP